MRFARMMTSVALGATFVAGCSSGIGQVSPTMPGGVVPTVTEGLSPAEEIAGYHAFVAAFRAAAAARGIPESVLATAFDTATFQPDVIARDREQPEFTRAIWD